MPCLVCPLHGSTCPALFATAQELSLHVNAVLDMPPRPQSSSFPALRSTADSASAGKRRLTSWVRTVAQRAQHSVRRADRRRMRSVCPEAGPSQNNDGCGHGHDDATNTSDNSDDNDDELMIATDKLRWELVRADAGHLTRWLQESTGCYGDWLHALGEDPTDPRFLHPEQPQRALWSAFAQDRPQPVDFSPPASDLASDTDGEAYFDV